MRTLYSRLTQSIAAFCAGLALLISTTAIAQTAEPVAAFAAGSSEVAAPNPANTDVVAFAQPSFPGGSAEMMKFVAQNTHYPEAAQAENAQGKVMVTFWVDEQGHSYGHGTIQSPHPSLAAEAIRVCKQMPAWSPGRQDGHLAAMQVYVPVMFKLAR